MQLTEQVSFPSSLHPIQRTASGSQLRYFFMKKLKSLCFHLSGNQPGIYTEMEIDSDIFLLNGGNILLKFVRKSPTTFLLEQLLPVDYPHTHQVISWSGVLWTRQEALRVQESLTAFVLGLDPIH